jgi:nitroreductase
MIFESSPSQLIRQRYSCRTYQKRPVSDQDISKLETFFAQCSNGPLGNHTRFRILPASLYDPRNLPRLGTYGFIKDPAAFLVGAASENPGALEDFGYSMELLILKATELELGTCWLGGTFTKSSFARQMDLQPGESIPAATSLGYPSNQKGWIDRVSRIYAGADRRLPWESLFFEGNWNTSYPRDMENDFSEPLQLVRLAPSASNKQPWRLIFSKGKWHFYLERSSNYPSPVFGKILRISDLQRIDMGIATAHFSLALQEGSKFGRWIHAEPHLTQPENSKEYIISWEPTSE